MQDARCILVSLQNVRVAPGRMGSPPRMYGVGSVSAAAFSPIRHVARWLSLLHWISMKAFRTQSTRMGHKGVRFQSLNSGANNSVSMAARR